MVKTSGLSANLLATACLLSCPTLAHAHAHMHGGQGQHQVFNPAGGGRYFIGYGSGGMAFFGASYISTYGAFGAMYAPPWSFVPPWPMMPNGAVGGPMPPGMTPPRLAPARRTDPAKATQLVTIGDRLFRAGNTKRAADRYEQARKLNPDAAAPLVRLAQIALNHADYSQAAERFREAIAAQPDFLAHAPNIMAIYAEPADFRKQLSRLESRVLAEPGDRDAWLVLGAQLFLSGQTKRAADVFTRLTDRRPDPTLAAFLEASTPLPVEK